MDFIDIQNRDIENVIFDLGGVVIDLKRERAVDALLKLGIEDANEMLGLYVQKGPFIQLEKGEVTAAEFFDLMMNRAFKGTSVCDIEKAFNSFLVDLPVKRLQYILNLRNAGTAVFALSNTNTVMYNSWIREKFSQQGLKIKDYFDGIVTSFEEGCCKPQPEIFLTLLQRYHLNPAKTLMLDDSEDNCRAAEDAGMLSFRINNSDDSRSMTHIIDYIINKEMSHG